MTMQCPKCNSDDVTRSRRKFWERGALLAVRAQVFRCRDCHHRFWNGVEWGVVILGSLAAAVTAIVFVVIVMSRQSRNDINVTRDVPRTVRRYRVPRGLPMGLPTRAPGNPESSQGDAVKP
jgi:hypothetical protein